ncbi:uncharacterized protein RCC_00139 [Ramularia collo-cygni]|uniref:INO80 complex subunit F domain-containing protein n=1 Tax=Ramularia collo-cygni TaxID=112498 RepID=A0A2D3UTP6_9PEZI|nr:uncharacterized protein RCC_00139 [Ramularia collo-cygni]CZT14166.1 uncharacterized protein RCC_00139 [Ramularia collo-cygni]
MNSDAATTPAPLAPSVEKAYYRKCIALKRRLNEVEAANDEARLRRLRLDRAIMKMRLERAFLLDELRRRMDTNIDGSDGSGEEGMATPPPDRPHRDKRRRPTSGNANGNQQTGFAQPPQQPGPQQYTPSQSRNPSDPNVGSAQLVPGPGNSMVPPNMVTDDGRYFYSEQQQRQAPPPMPHGSPYGPPSNGLPNSGGRSERVNSMNSMEVGAPSSTQAVGNGQEEHDGGRNAFTAVNQ